MTSMDAPFITRVLDLVAEIQQVPAPTFAERHRAEFMQAKFVESGLQDVSMDSTGNVYACIHGQGTQPPLVVSAHLDTVFPASLDLTLTRTPDRLAGPGIGDNSLGLAGLLGLAWRLAGAPQARKRPLPLAGDLWLVANVAEEGLGNLHGMKAVVDRFGHDARAYLVLEGMSLGQVYHRGLGVRRYNISVHTQGGHSWVDYGNPSAIHELAELVVKINNLSLPAQPRTTMNVGVISGGTSVNTIAADASLQLDLRSVSPKVLDEVASRVQRLVLRADKAGGEDVHVDCQLIGERPAGGIPADHWLVKLASQVNARHGIKTRLNIGSTDANVPLSRGIPAICIGLTTGGGTHTIREYIDVAPISLGLSVLVDMVGRIFEAGS